MKTKKITDAMVAKALGELRLKINGRPTTYSFHGDDVYLYIKPMNPGNGFPLVPLRLTTDISHITEALEQKKIAWGVQHSPQGTQAWVWPARESGLRPMPVKARGTRPAMTLCQAFLAFRKNHA